MFHIFFLSFSFLFPSSLVHHRFILTFKNLTYLKWKIKSIEFSNTWERLSRLRPSKKLCKWCKDITEALHFSVNLTTVTTVHVQYYVLQSGQDGTNQGQFEILADLMLHLQSTKISVFWKNYEKYECHWNMYDHKVHF